MLSPIPKEHTYTDYPLMSLQDQRITPFFALLSKFQWVKNNQSYPMLFFFHMPIYQHRFRPYLYRALYLGPYTLVDGCQLGSYTHCQTAIWTNCISSSRLFAFLLPATSVYHNVLNSVVDKDRQPIDVLTEDTYPSPVNVPGQERKAFAMLTPLPENPEKNLVAGCTFE